MRLNPALQGDTAEAVPPSLPVGVSSGKIGLLFRNRSDAKAERQMTLREFRCLTFLLCFLIQGYRGLVFSAEYRVGGVNPDALLCRPEGKGPFPAVVHNHGVRVDTVGYQKALRRGYDLPAILQRAVS